MASKEEILAKIKSESQPSPKEEILNKIKSIGTTVKEKNLEQPAFKPEDAINLKNTLNSRLQRINDKNLSDYAKTLTPEKIEELKSTSGVLHPELLEKKNPDAKYYFGKFYTGTGEAVENIADATIALGSNVGKMQTKTLEKVTSLGGLLPNKISENYRKMGDDLQKLKESAYANDFLPIKDATETLEYEYSPNKVEAVVGDVLSGTGGMLPTIASNLLVPGSGYATLGLQGAGGGTKQAYEKTGNLGAKEEIYGLLSGLSEIAVEKLSGGIGGLGNGAIDDIASKLIKNGFIRNATGEGIEEAVTTFIDPYLQRLTYDKGAEGAKASEVLRSAIVGSLTSMLLQGGSAAINLPQTIQQSKQNRADLQNSLEGIEKMLPTYESQVETAQPEKNVARELPTMASQQAMLPTNRIEGQTVQTGNIEQMAKNIENNNILEYNNDRGVGNGRETNRNSSQRGTLESEEEDTFSFDKYKSEEKRIREKGRLEYTQEEQGFADDFKRAYGKEAFIYDDLETDFGGGVSVLDDDTVLFGRKALNDYGQEFLKGHEVFEVINKQHKDIAGKDIKQFINKVQEDNGFGDVFLAYLGEMKPEVRKYYIDKPQAVAKEIIGDLYGISKSGEDINETIFNKLDANLVKEIQDSINNLENKIFNLQADTQSAFSMPKNDNQGRKLSKEQQEFFKDSKVRDNEGNLQVVYHGTNAEFTVFDANRYNYNDVTEGLNFFTNKRDTYPDSADDYANQLVKEKGGKKRIIEAYLDIKKPYVFYADGFYNAVSAYDANFRQIQAEYLNGDYDGIIVKYKNGKNDILYAVENSNQIKNVTNTRPTKDADIADTQSAFSMPKNYISPVQDMQKATEFVNKATVEDIDTLNKMIEEAEKYPDRVDLQFFAEKAREAIEKLSRQQVRQAIMEETGVESYNLDDVNKISKAKMNFTTPVRVIEKIFNKETANKINENFFKPIKHNEAERIRRLNKERADIKELDIKPGSAEDAAIQKYGEGEYVDENGLTIPYTLENLKRDFPDTWQKLQNATNVIRSKYDTYLEEINEVLQDNGYDPIPKRKDYFRHFEELNDLFSVLGVPTKVDDIPTDLNGMTADLKPGKQFFANALQRKGKKTTYSAVKGIDGYLDGAMNILYHTKDIQKLRTLDKYIRDTYGQAKGLADANTMTDEQKAKRINQINEGHLSEFAAWLTEYTNALAGKKSRLDRGVEEMFGRKSYKYLNLIKKQVGANMTGLNLNSALSNFISVIQAGPKTSKKALLKGTVDTIKNIFTKDGFIDKSDFLTTRFGTDKLAKNWWQKVGDAGQIFMSGTDYFTANLITRSKYQEFLDKGYTETEAIKKADEFADRLMAGRGKGDLPTAFESKMLGIVTQFQLEVTNQLDSIFYDTLHEDYAAESNSKLAKEHPKFYNAASATFILGQLFALAFLYNEGKEELTGTEGGALDPIGTIVDAIKYLTDENLSKPEAIAKIVEDIADQLPFASIITGGGRLPIKEAFPDLLSVAKGEAKLGDEMWKLTNLLLPTGGGQVKKTAQGLSTFAKGGSYTKDAEGKDKLKYPVEQTPSNAIKSALFGKWATPGAKDYIDRGFKPLSANQTEAYEKAMKAGISSDDFFKAYDATRGIESDKDRSGKTIENSKSKKLKEAIDKSTPKLTTKQRKILYDAFNVSKTVQGGSGLPTQSELRANLPKVQIKIEK